MAAAPRVPGLTPFKLIKCFNAIFSPLQLRWTPTVIVTFGTDLTPDPTSPLVFMARACIHFCHGSWALLSVSGIVGRYLSL